MTASAELLSKAPSVEDMLSTLLTCEVVVVAATPEMWSKQLHPVEERYVCGEITKVLAERVSAATASSVR